MDWKDVAGKVGSAAPMIGTILGGPVGGAIGGVVALIASALGLKAGEVTPEKINSLLATDPQAAIRLAEIEATHKIDLQKLLIEAERIRLADVADARQREIRTTEATGKRDINLYVLAWLVVTLFFTLVGILIWATLPQENIGPVNQLFGAMAAGFGMVLQYFFGSSKGSADKNQYLVQRPKE